MYHGWLSGAVVYMLRIACRILGQGTVVLHVSMETGSFEYCMFCKLHTHTHTGQENRNEGGRGALSFSAHFNHLS